MKDVELSASLSEKRLKACVLAMLRVQKRPDVQGLLVVLLHFIRVRKARRYQDVNSRTYGIGNTFLEELFSCVNTGI